MTMFYMTTCDQKFQNKCLNYQNNFRFKISLNCSGFFLLSTTKKRYRACVNLHKRHDMDVCYVKIYFAKKSPYYMYIHTCLEDIFPDDYVQDEYMHRSNLDKTVNEYGNMMLDFCKMSGLRILNGRIGLDANIGKYTLVNAAGCSTIDLVLCSKKMFCCVKSFNVLDPNILSDHCVVSFSLGCSQICGNNSLCNEDVKIDDTVDNIPYKYMWSDDKKNDYVNTLNNEETTHMLETLCDDIENSHSNDDIDSNLKSFCNIIEDICSPLFKKYCDNNVAHVCRANDGLYFDDGCKNLKHCYYKNLNMYRNYPCDVNRKNMVESRSLYKSTVRKKKCMYDKMQTKKLESVRLSNAKMYWKMLKGSVVKEECGNLSNADFLQYFKAINDPDSTFYQPDEDILYFHDRYMNEELNIMFEELNVPFSHEDIVKACNQLNNGKAAGPDYLLNEFFKHGINSNNFFIVVCTLFNKLLSCGYFPEAWSEGFIVPLHKKGDKNDTNNYRGITLLSTFGKLFTKVINNRLNCWAEKYHVYIEAQAGFRKNMGTVDNIFVLHGVINYLLENNKRLYAVFVDFTKAFDFLVRDVIWYKLLKLGIRGNMFNVIKSMYATVKSRIKMHNTISKDDFTCMLGVRQGESLSPFLFSMYLNDIEEYYMLNGFDGIDIGMLKLFLLLYADDIVIMADSEDQLKKGLLLLEQYCDRWKLSVNSTKTKVMIFKKGGRLRKNIVFSYKGVNLEIVKHFTYLGIIFTCGGSFTTTFDTLAGQASKAIFKLNSYLAKFPYMSISNKLDLFDKLILPILNYGSEVWGLKDSIVLERVHLNFCKRLLGVKIQTQNNFIYGELGRTTLYTRRVVNVIRYWLKVIKLDAHKYVKGMYSHMCSYIETRPNCKSWANDVCSLLQSLGFHYVWLNQGVGDENMFISLLKTRLNDMFIQNWMSELNNSSRARSYTMFSNFMLQPYLTNVNMYKFRKDMCRLRVSSHRLSIESGRWHKPDPIPYIDRKCLCCYVLEDEFHFILECSLYSDLRKTYISKYYWTRPNVPKFVELMQSDNVKVNRNLAMYIHKAFNVRNQYHYYYE
ncbi:uncharacterized protein LOC128211362 isoform X1 [Mya arenaria]|uniref:uncharacterized protein LOC128211362 isoform X1 n=1 Tax=Mya arenaria TaxID=6604 RepID=UPI0022E04AFC|nr:uncharacterized protein LOC128211362 isoform X1 [Mya arenaria]XP_052772034.1 uncharacterized protein LOC128211362 isoform X1 [Mya arenaria]XP_052772035.1 uncharacterized protein LOC128211362 isoform X1 [Mya arenaria]XP_052772036.1 uncharacterized protein LOC128211362 isoform X1 [Mya arenaria]